MPRERIGDAYVRIHAEGRGMGKEIKDNFDDFDPVIRGAGKNHGKTYSEAFNEELNRRGKANLISFAGEINKAFGRFDAGSQFTADFEDALVDLRKRVADEHGPEIGERLAQGIHDAMQRGSIQTRDDFLEAISDLRPAIARITSEIDRENEAALAKMLRDQEARLKQIERGEAETSAEIIDIKRRESASIIDALKERAAAEEKVFKEEHERVGQSEKDFDSLREAIEKYARGVTEAGTTHRSLLVQMRKLQAEMRNVGTNTSDTDREFRRFARTLQTTVPRISRTRTSLLGVADNFGRLFGRGSRNDFLNFIGAVVRGVARMTVSIVTGVAEFTAKFAQGIGEMISGLRNFSQTLSEQGLKAALVGVVDGFAFMGTTAATAGLNLLALAAAVGAMAGAAAIAVPLISGLLGILTALVSTIGFAAASALPALVAGLLPLVAGIGTVVAAFQGLDDAQKKALKADLKPLIGAFGDLADAAADVLFQDVGEWARKLKPLIEDLEPGVRGVAKAIRDVLGKAIDDAAESPKMEHFIERMNVFLPNAVRKLGDIFTNVFEGLGGVILAMLPSINRFLGWLGDITEEFSNWANSAKGRRELREFFKDAGDSAAALGDFLKQAVKFLAELLSQTRADGDQMFREMADAVQRMVEWLKSPEGKQAIEDWIDFAHDMFKVLGDVVVAAADLIDTLDNPTSRKVVLFILELFGDWIRSIDLIVQGFGKVVGLIDNIAAALGKIPGLDGFDALVGAIGGILPAGKDAAEGMHVFEQGINGVPVSEFKEGIQGILDSLDQITGHATAATKALLLTELQEQGLVGTARDLGISQRLLVNAFSGNVAAQKEMARQFLNNKNLTVDQRIAFSELLQTMGIYTGNLAKTRREIQGNTAATRDYSGLLKGLPDQVKTLVRTDGVRPSIRGIAGVIDKAKQLGGPNLTGKQIRTLITASGETPTKRMIERIRAALKRLAQQRTEPEIDPNIKPFDAREKHVREQLDRLEGRPPAKPRVDAEDKAFNTRIDRVKQMLTDLDNRPPSKPTIDLNTDPAYAARDNLVVSLNSINIDPVYIDVFYRTHGSPGGDTSTGPSAPSKVPERGPGRTISTGPVTIVEAADGKATAQEFLNHLAGLSY